MNKLAAVLESWGPGGAFLLALLDSAGIPLPAGVDALIILLAATNRRLAYPTAALTVLGSAIGCMILYSLARKGGQLYLERHAASPRGLRFRDWFGRYGLVTVFVPALVPIPLPVKVFVLSAGALGVRPRSFLLVVLAARLPRYFGLAYLGSRLGDNTLPWLQAHAWHLGAFALVLLLVLFVLLRVTDRPPAS